MSPVWGIGMDWNKAMLMRCSCLLETREIELLGFYYVIHDSGTAVFDCCDNLVGNFETETEAINMIRACYGE